MRLKHYHNSVESRGTILGIHSSYIALRLVWSLPRYAPNHRFCDTLWHSFGWICEFLKAAKSSVFTVASICFTYPRKTEVDHGGGWPYIFSEAIPWIDCTSTSRHGVGAAQRRLTLWRRFRILFANLHYRWNYPVPGFLHKIFCQASLPTQSSLCGVVMFAGASQLASCRNQFYWHCWA